MPELPEVETIVRELAPLLPGRRIIKAELPCPRVVVGPVRRAVGRTIRRVSRHGKFIVVEFEGTAGRLAIHLGMTGRLLAGGERGPHTHAVFTLDRGALIYADPRQFGRIQWLSGPSRRLDSLGPDPLELDEDAFLARLRARRAMVKPLLLNQRFLRGLGNIYTDEALHRAGIHPRATAARLSRARAARLYRAIRKVLNEAIARGGSSVSDYVDAGGRRGWFQLRHPVYGREGEPCLTCGALIRRIVVAQRGTHFCPRCQKRFT